MTIESPNFEQPKQPEKEFVVPEEFESDKYKEEKKKYDPLHKFVREEMGLDPEKFGFVYRFIVEKRPDLKDPQKERYIRASFSNYHDYLRRRKDFNEEQKKELDVIYTHPEWGTWKSPALFANQKFWKRLDNPEDELYKYRDSFFELQNKILNEQLDDEYAKAVQEGKIKEIYKEEPEKRVEEGLETEAKEKSPEELALDQTRTAYAEAYKDYQKAFGKKGLSKVFGRTTPEKELIEFEETIKEARKYIELGDSEKLASKGTEKEFLDASERRGNFINELIDRGIAKNRALAIYKIELKKAEYEETKRKLGYKLITEKAKEIQKEFEKKSGKSKRDWSKEERQEIIKKIKEYRATELLEKLVVGENETLLANKPKVESWPPKEKNILRRGLEWWIKQPTHKRVLYSTLALTGGFGLAGVGLGVGALAGASAATMGLFAGGRFLRGIVGAVGGQLIAKGTVEGVDKLFFKTLKKAEEEKRKLAETFTLDKLPEIEKRHQKNLEAQYKRKRNKTLAKAIIASATGAGISFGLAPLIENALGVKLPTITAKPSAPETPSKLPSQITPEELKQHYPGIKYEMESAEAEAKLQEFQKTLKGELAPPETPTEPKGPLPFELTQEIKPEILPIGERGPEGAIIDYLRENPEVAVKKFGCSSELVKDGWIIDEKAFDKWAGSRAHQLWLDDAKEALHGPNKAETLVRLQKLGYPVNEEGYAQMMHRIGKGAVEIDPQSGKINLVDEMKYLKAKAPSGIQEVIETKKVVETPPTEVVETPKPEAEIPPEIKAWEESGEMIKRFEDYNLLEQERTLNMLDKDIKTLRSQVAEYYRGGDNQMAKQLNQELSRQENLQDILKNNFYYGANKEGFERYINQFLATNKEFKVSPAAFKSLSDVKVGKFLAEMSRYQKDEIEWPDLSSYGRYKSDYQNLFKLFQTEQWKGIDKGLTIEAVIKSKTKM